MNTTRNLGSLSIPVLLAAATSAQSYTAMPADIGSVRDITPDGQIIVGSGGG